MPIEDDDVRDADTVEIPQEARTDVYEYIKRSADNADTQSGIRFVLAQTAKSTAGSDRIITDDLTWELGEDIKKLAEEILDEAVRYARTVSSSGRMKFSLTVDGRRGRCTFALTVHRPFDEDEDEDEVDELPTAEGLVIAAQKHAQVMTKEALAASKGARKDLREENTELRARVRDLESLYFQQVMKAGELARMDWAVERERRKLDREDRFREEGMKMVGQVAPQLMARFLGGDGQQPGLNGPPAGATPNGQGNGQGAPQRSRGPTTPTEYCVQAFIRSSSQEQIEGIMRLLRPEQIALFGEMYQEIVTWETSSNGRAPEPTNGHANGTNGTGGAAYEAPSHAAYGPSPSPNGAGR